MNIDEYAKSRKRTIEQVYDAMSQTNQNAHERGHIDVARLDDFFGISPAEVAAKTAAAAEPKRLRIGNSEIVLAQQGFQNRCISVYGQHEQGMKIFRLVPTGKKAPVAEHGIAREFLALGHDPSQAIANVVSSVWALRHNLVDWKVLGTVDYCVQ